MSGEMQRLLARWRRTEQTFSEWKEDREKGGGKVADTCGLSVDVADKVFKDAVTVLLYFLHNMQEFEETIKDLAVCVSTCMCPVLACLCMHEYETHVLLCLQGDMAAWFAAEDAKRIVSVIIHIYTYNECSLKVAVCGIERVASYSEQHVYIDQHAQSRIQRTTVCGIQLYAARRVQRATRSMAHTGAYSDTRNATYIRIEGPGARR
jgi:hypothetical protein